jgi:Ca2+-binding RTX toxin-like protein
MARQQNRWSRRGRSIVELLEQRRLLSAVSSIFFAKDPQAAGNGPDSIVTADFNGDSLPDLAVADQDGSPSPTVDVLLNEGGGIFAPAESLTVQSTPKALAEGDLRNDGKIDLVSANEFGHSVSVLLGNGDGSFQAADNIALGSTVYPVGVAIGDVTGDGIPDIVVASSGGFFGGFSGIIIIPGNGDGTFKAPQQIALGNGTDAVALADLSNNNLLDIVAANGEDDTLNVLMSNGNGTFQPATTLAVGNTPKSVTAADLTNDGTIDLVVTNGGAPTNQNPSHTISILMGNGDGTFQPQEVVSVGSNPYDAVVADFNGDGIPDLAVANRSDSTVSVMLGNGNGTFQPAMVVQTGTFDEGIVAADFDRKGDIELATADLGTPEQTQGDVTVLLQTPFISEANGTLTVVGDVGPDAIDVNTDGDGNLIASLNGQEAAPIAISSLSLVIAKGTQGADSITIDSGVTVPASVLGGKGADTLYASNSANDTLFGGKGHNSITGAGRANASIPAATGNDLLMGGIGPDSISAGDGNDTIQGGYGNDSLTGGPGADIMQGGPGADSLVAGDGPNSLYGGTGPDDLVGTVTGGQLLSGGRGFDTIDSNTNSDSPADTLLGGRGNDTIIHGPNDLGNGGGQNDSITTS